MTTDTPIHPYTLDAARLRVGYGARWLDENFPGWEDRINTTTLNLESGSRCICGQVFEDEAERIEFEGGLCSYGTSGFGYAFDHLFAQANSWITGLVHMEAVEQDTTWREAWERANKVAAALGFQADGFTGMPSVSYELLEDAWRIELEERQS